MAFIKAKATFKSNGSQPYPSVDVFINTETIFIIKGENIVLKPEFEPFLSQSIYGTAQIKIASITATQQDINKVTE